VQVGDARRRRRLAGPPPAQACGHDAIAGLIAVAAVSMLVACVATVILTLTGMTARARLQAPPP
jgi:hypothetical protein